MSRTIVPILSLVLFFSSAPALAALPAPTNIRAIVNKTIVWDAVPGATFYSLEWRGPGLAQWQPQPIENGATSYRSRRFEYGIEYLVRVRAKGGIFGNSLWSDPVPITFPPPKELAKPVLVKGDGVSVSWSRVNGAKEYFIRLHNGKRASTYRQDGNILTFSFAKALPGVTYKISVRAAGDGIHYKRRGMWSEPPAEFKYNPPPTATPIQAQALSAPTDLRCHERQICFKRVANALAYAIVEKPDGVDDQVQGSSDDDGADEDEVDVEECLPLGDRFEVGDTVYVIAISSPLDPNLQPAILATAYP